jgi:hypothetical protein
MNQCTLTQTSRACNQIKETQLIRGRLFLDSSFGNQNGTAEAQTIQSVGDACDVAGAVVVHLLPDVEDLESLPAGRTCPVTLGKARRRQLWCLLRTSPS